jgi:hypothetical protein
VRESRGHLEDTSSDSLTGNGVEDQGAEEGFCLSG